MSPVADPSLPTIDVGSTTSAFCPDLWTYYNEIESFIYFLGNYYYLKDFLNKVQFRGKNY